MIRLKILETSGKVRMKGEEGEGEIIAAHLGRLRLQRTSSAAMSNVVYPS